MTSIYILRLVQNKYYVGRSNQVKDRIDQHYNGNGSAWTQKYKPLELYALYNNCDPLEEDFYTLKMMKEFGIDNVRGGSFSNVILTSEQIAVLQTMICSSESKCFKCNQPGHFMSQCTNRKYCHRCDTLGHWSKNCTANVRRDGSEIGYNCYRCGRNGHWKIVCSEMTDIHGRVLNQNNNCIIS